MTTCIRPRTLPRTATPRNSLGRSGHSRWNGTLVTTTPGSNSSAAYELLEALVTNPGKLLTHRWLLSRVWGGAYGDESHYVRVYVAQLRRKLEEEPSRPRWILTEPGLGYRWAEEPVT